MLNNFKTAAVSNKIWRGAGDDKADSFIKIWSFVNQWTRVPYPRVSGKILVFKRNYV